MENIDPIGKSFYNNCYFKEILYLGGDLKSDKLPVYTKILSLHKTQPLHTHLECIIKTIKSWSSFLV